MNGFNAIEQRLLNEFQRDFPLVRRPFLEIGNQLGIAEDEVIELFGRLSAQGAVSRIGPVFSPGCIGASTLAALAVPAERLESLAQRISALPEVNHNYEREHRYNLWFVAAAPHQAQLDLVLRRIAQQADCPMLTLPLVESFHIDLGFDLNGGGSASHRLPDGSTRVQLNDTQAAIVAALQCGLRLERQPFAAVSAGLNVEEDVVLEQLAQWLAQRVIKRFGVVVRHHELGYRENAMVAWDVPDDLVGRLGRRAATEEGVTLCYRRARQLPDWPLNLFCMVHGKNREVVEENLARLASSTGLDEYPSQTLFSRRRFKQCGARYVADGRN